MKNTCKVVVGRLIEIDVAAGYQTVADVEEMIAMLAATVGTSPPGQRLVIAADWRTCKVFTTEVANRAMKMLAGPHMQNVERSAILHRADAPTSVMQVFRLVREAQFPFRKVFTDPKEMQDWLADILTAGEQERLRMLLAAR